MRNTKIFSFCAGSLLALALMAFKANAENQGDWGDLGYSKTSPEVEAIPMGLTDETSDPRAVNSANDEISETRPIPASGQTVAASEVKAEDLSAAPDTKPDTKRDSDEKTDVVKAKPSRASNISTLENTYGVETEERTRPTLYVSPFAGSASVMGNDTADNNPQYAVGASVGLLISSNMMLELGFTHAEQNFSNPRSSSTQGVFVTGESNVFALKQNILDAGVKLFILGRESRFRPFVGGGLGYSRGTLNYTQAYQQAETALGNGSRFNTDMTLNQFDGFGELGTEFAITRNIVATASFRLHGVLSSNTSADSTPDNYDPSKVLVGSSLSRTASYLIAAGLGIYF